MKYVVLEYLLANDIHFTTVNESAFVTDIEEVGDTKLS
jgi:hypothetical protein